MRAKGIEVQIGTYALHMHKAFQASDKVHLAGTFENSAWSYQHALALPLFHDLTLASQELIVEELTRLL